MLSFFNNIDLVNKFDDLHQTHLSEQSLDKLISSLQEASLEKLETLYVHIFDLFVEIGRTKSLKFFSTIDDNMLKLITGSGEQIYNRLIPTRWSNEKQLRQCEHELSMLKADYKKCLKDEWWLKHIRSSDDDPVKLQFKKLKVKCIKTKEKVFKIRGNIQGFRESMTNFLVRMTIMPY